MPVESVADFAESLRRGRLLDAAQLDELTRKFLPRFPEPKALARDLVKRGWLTPYQVNELFKGRGDELLLGSYVVLDRLGEGGMGQVFKARNWKMGGVVAVKVIRKDRLSKEVAVRRFEREIAIAAHLDHPNIVRALDADRAGDAHFLVMEFVEGTNLSQLVKEHGPLSASLACDFIRQAALGLQYAHEKGLVHRDIKPANLLLAQAPGLRSAGLVKVLDMGLARLLEPGEGEAFETLTREGAIMGSLDYLAPEQAINSHGADIRADLYGLGCTLYYLLTGEVPFPARSPMEKLLRHRTDQPKLEEKLPDVPPAVAAVVRRLMAKKPEDRYQTPAEAAAALAAAAVARGARPHESAGARAAEIAALAAPVSAETAEATSTWSVLVKPQITAKARSRRRSPEWQRRALWLGVAGAAVLLGLMLLLIALLHGRG
jgi:serine/threonine protein kinase